MKWLAAAAVAFAVAVVARAWVSGRAELREAEAARARGDEDGYLLHLGRAARWRFPGSVDAAAALAGLRDAALLAEHRGDGERARAAWESLRGALYATRSLALPRRALLDEANAHLADLYAAADPLSSDGRLAARRAWHLERLARDEAAGAGGSLIALAGLAAWIAGGWIWPTRRRAALALIACGLVAFAAGLAMA